MYICSFFVSIQIKTFAFVFFLFNFFWCIDFSLLCLKVISFKFIDLFLYSNLVFLLDPVLLLVIEIGFDSTISYFVHCQFYLPSIFVFTTTREESQFDNPSCGEEVGITFHSQQRQPINNKICTLAYECMQFGLPPPPKP
jgi:hypothetical protein